MSVNKCIYLFQGGFNILNAGRITTTNMIFSAFPKRIAGNDRHLFLKEQFFTEFLTAHAGNFNGRETKNFSYRETGIKGPA
jgi:hypothetical protein